MHWIKHNKVKKCGAAKGAKLSSWLLPQGDYKWVEVIQSLIKKTGVKLSTRHLAKAAYDS